MVTYADFRHVRLTEAEADEVDAAAARVQRGARAANLHDAWGEPRLRSDEVGYRGERAVAKELGLPWQPSFTPQGTRPDVGPYEVKTRSMEAKTYSDQLHIPARRIVRARIYVAVRAWSRLDHDVVGWITGAEAMELHGPPVATYRWAPNVTSYVVWYSHLHAIAVLP